MSSEERDSSTPTVSQHSTLSYASLTLYPYVGRCVGDTTAIPRLGIPSICFQDGPAGVRLVKNVTGFPAGINAAATFSRRLIRARGQAIGEEFRGKGVQ